MIVQPAKAYVLADYEQLMAHLAHAREDQKLTFAEVGERAGCHLQQVHNWINGGAECRSRRLFDLAHALGYDLALIPTGGRAVNWTREEFEQDKIRYQRELKALLAQGLTDGHPLVERQRRRIETVERVLTDPAYGLADGAEDA